MPMRMLGSLLAIAVMDAAIVTTAALAQDGEKGRAPAERLCARCHLNPAQGEAGSNGSTGIPGSRHQPNQSTQGIVAWRKDSRGQPSQRWVGDLTP
jgi:cytochrome c553